MVNGKHSTFTIFNDVCEELYKICVGKEVPKSSATFEDDIFDQLPIDINFKSNQANIISFISKIQ